MSMLTGAKRADHSSPVFRQLHWLPVRQRDVFKIATLVHQSLPGFAPGYLADDRQVVTDARARQLRSADTRTLTVHRTSSCFGDRTFAAAATRVWNSLPSDLRKADLSYSRLTRSLGKFLFGQPDHCALQTLLTASFTNIITYLLMNYLLNERVKQNLYKPVVRSVRRNTRKITLTFLFHYLLLSWPTEVTRRQSLE